MNAERSRLQRAEESALHQRSDSMKEASEEAEEIEATTEQAPAAAQESSCASGLVSTALVQGF